MPGTAFSSQHAGTTTRRSPSPLTELFTFFVNMFAEIVASSPKPETIVDDDDDDDDDVRVVRNWSRRRQ